MHKTYSLRELNIKTETNPGEKSQLLRGQVQFAHFTGCLFLSTGDTGAQRRKDVIHQVFSTIIPSVEVIS